MSKFLQKVLVLSVVMMALSVSYYFFIFLPRHKKAEFESEDFYKQQQLAQRMTSEELANKERCDNAGRKAFEKTQAEDKGIFIYGSPKFLYSKKLNTCVYIYTDYLRNMEPLPSNAEGGAPFAIKVKDSFTNELILSYTNNIFDKEGNEKRRKEFDEQYDALFSE